MRNFWSYVTRDRYGIGCTGQSVYVYEDDREVLRASGFQYTYKSCISPSLDFFALKSNTGLMYVYSLKDLKQVAKKRFMKADTTQDRMFAFSPAGDELISVDQYGGFHSCITHYAVPTLEIRARYMNDREDREPFAIELPDDGGTIYALIQERNADGIVNRHSVGLIRNGVLVENRYITEREFALYAGFKELQAGGFTSRAKEWSALKYEGYDLSNIENQHYSIAKLFEFYRKRTQP